MRFLSADGSYGIGTQVQLEVSFSENVKINGSMTLTLQLMGQQFLQHFHLMDLLHCRGNIFSYTIADGDSASDINYAGRIALHLLGRELSSIWLVMTVTLTLPDPASAPSASSSISIDEVLPTITSQKAGLGGTSVVIGFSEVVSGSPAATTLQSPWMERKILLQILH